MARNLIQESLEYLLQLPQNIEESDSIFHILNDPKQHKKLFQVIDAIDPRYVEDISRDIYGVPIRDKKNNKVIRSDAQISYDNIHHLINWGCAKDIFYFTRFFRIVTVDDGLIYIPLRDYQIESLQNFINHPFNVMNSCRQSGKSTSMSIYSSWKFLFRPYNNAAILANKFKVAKGLLRRIKIAYQNLPFYLQQPMEYYNVGKIEGVNGSVIEAFATTEDGIASESINDLIVDEVAKIPKNIWTPFWTSTRPVVSSATRKESISVMFASTPLGDNHFKKIVEGAALEGTKQWNGFHLQTITYRDIPEKNNKKWRDSEIAATSLEEFQQEYEAMFVTQKDIYFNNKVLDTINVKRPIKDHYIQSKLKEYVDDIFIYEKPKPGRVYALSFDPSEMRATSQKGENDNFGIQIVDVTDMREGWKQVLTINFEEEFDYLESPAIVTFLAQYYNMAWIIGENNKCKDILNSIKKEYHYENVFKEDSRKEYLGYRTTKLNKPAHAKLLKILLNRDILKINDADTLLELKKFTKTLKAPAGYNDGMVLSMMGIMVILTLSEDRIESMFGSEEEGICIKKGKALLQLAIDIDKGSNENDIQDIIVQVTAEDDRVNEILENNGFSTGNGYTVIM